MQGSVDAHGIYRAVLKVHDREGNYQRRYGTGLYPCFQVEFTADMIHKEMVRQMEKRRGKAGDQFFLPRYRPVDTSPFPCAGG